MDKYNHLMVDLRDPRADAWPLMSSIWPTTTICVVYVLTVKVFGPRYDAIGLTLRSWSERSG